MQPETRNGQRAWKVANSPPELETIIDDDVNETKDDLSPNQLEQSDRDRARYAGRRAVMDDNHSLGSLPPPLMPDFLSPSMFRAVLGNRATAHQLARFSETRFSGENVEFLMQVAHYHKTLNELASTMSTIHKTFITDNSLKQLMIHQSLLMNTHKQMRSLVTTALPAMERLFTETQDTVEQLVYTDLYPRFVRHQLTLSATWALAGDRFRYQGLGDCFCLTSPAKADNPILFASDGFVSVTGYQRSEIIPRNCRFLQGAYTERAAVSRLKAAIDKGKVRAASGLALVPFR
jgi:hypothetical protein